MDILAIDISDLSDDSITDPEELVDKHSTEHKPDAVSSTTELASINKDNDSSRSSKRDRKGDGKIKPKSRSPQRSRSSSYERSRSPRHRLRHHVKKSCPPTRRLGKGFSRRKLVRSSLPNRSLSPTTSRSRSRSPPRKQRTRLNVSSSTSRSRSPPNNQTRSRSPAKEKFVKKDAVVAQEETPAKETVEKSVIPSSAFHTGDPGEKSAEVSKGSGRCRDFDEKGLCMKGKHCPYDHGQDPVVLEDVLVLEHIQRHSSGYNQHFLPHQIFRGPRHNVHPCLPSHRLAGEYYPDNPGVEPMMGWQNGPPSFRSIHQGPRCRPGLLPRPMLPFPVSHQRELISVPVMDVPTDMNFDMTVPYAGFQPIQPRGRRFAFDHSRLGRRRVRNIDNCSLEVKKIPREMNNIMDLNRYFLRFGKILNIQINYENDPEASLITFSSPMEAQAAYRCPEAVLNNRFIRVYWHNAKRESEDNFEMSSKQSLKGDMVSNIEPETLKPVVLPHESNSVQKSFYTPALLKGQTEIGNKTLALEAIKRSQEMLAAEQSAKREKDLKKQDALKFIADIVRRKQLIMNGQIEEQKKLIAKLEGSRSFIKAEERYNLMSLIKSLQGKIESSKRDVDEVVKFQLSTKPKTIIDDFNQAKRQSLDTELEMYHKDKVQDTSFNEA